jgi:hypothetical protein
MHASLQVKRVFLTALQLSPQPLVDDGFREYLSGFQHALVTDCLFSFSLVMKTIWLQGGLRVYLPS